MKLKKTDHTEIDTQNEQTQTPSKGYRVFKVVRTIFVYILAAAIIISALLFASSVTPDKSLFGYRYYTVLTPSMEPTYRVGDMVFVKIEKADNIAVGDVITFNPSADGDAYLTHRVVEKLEDYQGSGVTCFKTKGDANDSDDSFLIDEGRLIGKVKFGIPVFGYIVRFVQLRWYYIVPLIILIIVFFKLIGIYLASRNKKEEAVEEAAVAPAEAAALGENAASAEAEAVRGGEDASSKEEETVSANEEASSQGKAFSESESKADENPNK